MVGATRAEALQEIRDIIPKAFLLVPGVGALGQFVRGSKKWTQ